MGKSLMAGIHGQTLSTTEKFNFGGALQNTTEGNNQYNATEDCTFTGLRGNIISGNDVSATFLFRNNTANGNETATRAGPGLFEDTTNSDAVTAGNPYCITYTDTGTDSLMGPVAINVEFASGHGSYHGSSNTSGIVLDVPSATRYLPIQGTIIIDASATIDPVQFEVREYTTIEAFQVNVSANARVNDTVFRVNVNGVDTGTGITYAAAATGRQVVTGMGIALSPGDLVCYSVTLLTGVEDFTILTTCMTLKATTPASANGLSSPGGVTRAASATPNYYSVGQGVSSAEASSAVKIGFAARQKNLRCYLSANTYTADATLRLFVNGSPVLTTTITAGGGAGWYRNLTNEVTLAPNDTFSFEIVGGTSGSITIHQIWVSSFNLAVGVGLTESPLLQRRRLAA